MRRVQYLLRVSILRTDPVPAGTQQSQIARPKSLNTNRSPQISLRPIRRWVWWFAVDKTVGLSRMSPQAVEGIDPMKTKLLIALSIVAMLWNEGTPTRPRRAPPRPTPVTPSGDEAAARRHEAAPHRGFPCRN